MIATANKLAESLRLVARHFDGPNGVWAYDAFDAIDAAFFAGELPMPKIQWAITPHGRCLGLTRMTDRPVITLHPSLLGGSEKANPWGVDPAWLGMAYAFDVLLHESIHVAQHCLHGGGVGPTSHNNTAWIAEVNRIAPLLGMGGVSAGRSRTKRVPIGGQTTVTGKPATKVVRQSDGNLPHDAIARFPHAVRVLFGNADRYYRGNTLPVTSNYVTSQWIPRAWTSRGGQRPMTTATIPPKPQRPAAPRFMLIPAELRDLAQWVVWRYEFRNGKWTKMPYQPGDPSSKAKADDPSTWGTFAEAEAAYHAGGFNGIGFEFSRDDPYFGVDLDNCLKDGEVLPWAASMLEMLEGTYGEISPSGNGVKFIGRGKLPGDTGTRRSGLGPDETGALEVYDHGRFFTITGDVWGE
jgi:hypothetical protein